MLRKKFICTTPVWRKIIYVRRLQRPGLRSRCRSCEESKVFGWIQSRIPKNTKSRWWGRGWNIWKGWSRSWTLHFRFLKPDDNYCLLSVLVSFNDFDYEEKTQMVFLNLAKIPTSCLYTLISKRPWGSSFNSLSTAFTTRKSWQEEKRMEMKLSICCIDSCGTLLAFPQAK